MQQSAIADCGMTVSRPVTTTLQGATGVRHPPFVAPGMELSNTRGTTPSGSQSELTSLIDDGAAAMARGIPQNPHPWREFDVILPRHDLRERDHQRRQGNADNGLYGTTIRSWPVSGRRAYSPSSGLER